MDIVVERCCGLDVHKDSVVACVRTPGKGGKRAQETRTFGTMTTDLLALRDWLVAMEVMLNARHLRNVPGRKTDVADAEWVCQLVEHGLVRPSFVAPKEIRELRDLTG